jgi:hypothetical protein
MAAAILAIRRDDLRFAGVMFAIATIKPQLVLLLGIYLFCGYSRTGADEGLTLWCSGNVNPAPDRRRNYSS